MFHMIFHQIVHIISFNNNYALTRHLFKKKKKTHLFYLKNKKKKMLNVVSKYDEIQFSINREKIV